MRFLKEEKLAFYSMGGVFWGNRKMLNKCLRETACSTTIEGWEGSPEHSMDGDYKNTFQLSGCVRRRLGHVILFLCHIHCFSSLGSMNAGVSTETEVV